MGAETQKNATLSQKYDISENTVAKFVLEFDGFCKKLGIAEYDPFYHQLLDTTAFHRFYSEEQYHTLEAFVLAFLETLVKTEYIPKGQDGDDIIVINPDVRESEQYSITVQQGSTPGNQDKSTKYILTNRDRDLRCLINIPVGKENQFHIDSSTTYHIRGTLPANAGLITPDSNRDLLN